MFFWSQTTSLTDPAAPPETEREPSGGTRSGLVEDQSPDPDRTQGFYRALFGWGFRRAFDEPNSELGRRYWSSNVAAPGSEGCRSPCRPHRRRTPGCACTWRWTTSKRRCHEPSSSARPANAAGPFSEPTTSGSRTCEIQGDITGTLDQPAAAQLVASADPTFRSRRPFPRIERVGQRRHGNRCWTPRPDGQLAPAARSLIESGWNSAGSTPAGVPSYSSRARQWIPGTNRQRTRCR